MNSISALENIFKKGLFGDYENKKDNEIIKLSESKKLFICQVVKYKNSNVDEKKLKIDELNLPDSLKTTFNNETRIIWMGPSNWLVVSKKLDLMKFISTLFDDNNFAITDLSHSRKSNLPNSSAIVVFDALFYKHAYREINNLKEH